MSMYAYHSKFLFFAEIMVVDVVQRKPVQLTLDDSVIPPSPNRRSRKSVDRSRLKHKRRTGKNVNANTIEVIKQSMKTIEKLQSAVANTFFLTLFSHI